MHDSKPAWLRLFPIGLFLLLLSGAAGASLTVINLRQETGRFAASVIKLQNETAESGRRFQEITASVAAAVQPAALRNRVGTRLLPMTDKQIIWVGPGTASTSLLARQSTPSTSSYASAELAARPSLLP